MDQDLILVSVSYRLGPLGFLTLENDVIEGNMGMKDLVLALKWVRQNIHAFGGDENNVSIMGESAGGMSAMYLMLSPRAKVRKEGIFLKKYLIICLIFF